MVRPGDLDGAGTSLSPAASAAPGGPAVPSRGPAEMPVLEAVGLSKSFGAVQAVAGMSVAVRRGEIVALVGDNGAGKSTTVAMLSGLIQPDEGVIRVQGEEVRLSDPKHARRLGISTVFQDLALVNQRDVAQNLYLGQELKKFGFMMDRRQMLARSAYLLRHLGVNVPSVRTKVGDLSGGQRQAVAVARAVLQGGQITLLDEPTAALGVREGRKVLDIVARLRDEGHAVLLISHNLDTVFGTCDRIVVMRLGTVIADVRTADVEREDVVAMIVGGRALQWR
jgi:D-xylose transport system ATP-binding protein